MSENYKCTNNDDDLEKYSFIPGLKNKYLIRMIILIIVLFFVIVREFKIFN